GGGGGRPPPPPRRGRGGGGAGGVRGGPRGEYAASPPPPAAARHKELVPDRLVDLMALAGDPAEVRDRVRGVMSVAGIGRIILLPQVPGAGFAERAAILRLFPEDGMARRG